MKVALFVGFVFFCSLWTIGSFRQCSSCTSSISYDDCQSKLKVTNCTNDDGGCFHVDVKAEKDQIKHLPSQKVV
ncbi:hypothetical protein OS493_034747 [Desmophyllum pertusum]|uniref:Uncharacterized protein n=1 Tax=Desmophyllum pertusum TaxID=174260 RepID=A0A9W9YV88_9CNID|nr:hypothetical protein OS493_034747 [Desmophyllum pertusum]